MTYNTSEEAEKLENKRFNLVKDLTILAGTIFGLSVALAVGKQGNIRFIIGEFLLFLSLCSGIILLYAALKGKEFFHYMMTSSDLKLNLKKRTGGKEDFIVDAQEDLVKRYENLMDVNRKDFLFPVLKIIKINYFFPTFFITFVLGVLFILISLL